MEEIINDEIVSAIMAAIALMESKPGYSLVVKSFRRVPQIAPVWSATGRYERLNSKI
ncbi:hypothetical protein [Acetivibrio cellulolyticus]|uniref:hypothetical protein n=1 Tax=Acetivibrio cellulolyticus TaxID=35830 RepID=UPI0001E2F137|nr:hypothetical protein [Acetivibrio cellulolyticus]